MVFTGGYGRGFATDVVVEPAVAGASNVQAALAALAAAPGGVVLGNFSTDEVSQTVPTALTADGASHAVSCVIAAPPAWMDNAGNIIAAGLYNAIVTLVGTVAPTTPGLYVRQGGVFNNSGIVSLDGLGLPGTYGVGEVQSLAVADVPYAVGSNIEMPTDVTGALTVQISVCRLAHG